MSLDITLVVDGEDVFSANITHNLGRMAAHVGIYDCLWRAPENGFDKAHQLVPALHQGILSLALHATECKSLSAPNGWGTWKQFLPWVAELYEACSKYPQAVVRTSR